MPFAANLLDVATGTADLAVEIMRQGKASHVTGMDLSSGMLDVGREKLRRAGLSEAVSLVEASALDMPFEDASFDALTCAYGVRNFSDLDRGLAEMFRVLKPGGTLMILEFSYPSNPVIRCAYDLYFSRFMPLVGKLVSGDKGSYVYFRDSVKNFIWGQDMADRISSAGFRDVTFRTMTFGITTVYFAHR